MNPTIELINARTSTRTFADTPITTEEKQAVLAAAMRAPTGGAMMLYSIIQVEDQALKDRLAVTCDDQPFIAKAPWVLVFVADFQRWMDLFAITEVTALEGVDSVRPPGPGDFMLACSDALIAAQTAAIAAESLGIGSCYIGDILELGETHAELLGLPEYTFPVAMLVLGRPTSPRQPTPHCTSHVVHTDQYQRLTAAELQAYSDDLGEMYGARMRPGLTNYPQDVYQRKFASAFMAEMNRSVAWWLERWQTPAG
ncbi:MAG: nitroreductase family protein [Coriobacteriia bacterium]